MLAIFVDGRRIGTVAKFVGNKPAERWVAWSIHQIDKNTERSEKFRTQREAVAWLEKTDREVGQ